MKKTVLAMVVGMLLVGPALAQNVQVGGEQQQRNTEVTSSTKKVFDRVTGKEIGENKVTTNINLPTVPAERTNPTGAYQYSGIPCKWMRTPGKTEKAVVAPEEKK